MKLEQAVAWWQGHLLDERWVPSAHHMAAAVGIGLDPLDEVDDVRSGVPDKKSLVEVAVHAVVERRDIDVDEVTVDEHGVIRNPMADHLIEGGATGFREAAVAELGRDRPMVEDKLVAKTVEFLRRDARHNVGRHMIQCLGGKFSGLAHAVKSIGVVNADAARFGIE